MKKVQSAAMKVHFNDNEGKIKDHVCIFSVFSILPILKIMSLYDFFYVLTPSNEITSTVIKQKKFWF